MKRKYIKTLALGLALTCAAPAMAQSQKTYMGTIVDSEGNPVIGATVRIPGTNFATTTDLDGNYALRAPEGKQLTVSYIGLEDAKTVGGRLQMKNSDNDLNEIVVVGYDSQKRAHLTGAVSSVPTDEMLDLSNGGLAASLSGLVNGVSISGGTARPGENSRIYIRDTNALAEVGSVAQEPLFVIDGYIYPNDVKVGNTSENLGAQAFNNLDASEIESISVLKDASAAVYGARAANGVILVTTKRGKIGAPRISYNGSFGFTDEVSRPKMLSAYEYGRLYNAVAAADPTKTGSLNKLTGLYQADELNAMKDLNYDLLDKYWQTGMTQKHSINVSGANDNVNYFAGLSYFDQDGNLGKLDYNRWNYRAGVDVKINKWLGASLQVSGDHAKKNTPLVKVGGTNAEKDYGLLLTRPTYLPETVNGYDILPYGVPNSKANDSQLYAFDVLQNDGDYKRNMTSNLNVNGSVSYDFGWSKVLQGLKLKFSYCKSINTDKGNEYGSSYTLYNMLERYGSGSHLYTPVGGVDQSNLADKSNYSALNIANGNYLSRSSNRTDNYQINFTASYARDFGLNHIQALFSVEKSEAENEYQTTQREKPYPFTTGQSNSASGDLSGVFTRSESGTLSYIGRLNYAWADRYLLEVLVRSDASTKFAPENYWGTFPAASAGWVMSEEPWFKKVFSAIDFFKLRGSFGLTGRDNTAPWQWMQVYAQDANKGVVFGEGTGNPSGNRVTINKNNSAVNRDVHWDKDYKMNLGLDAHFFAQRLSLSFDAYREWNREILMNLAQNVEFTVGTQSAAVNKGQLDQWGYELSLNWHDNIGKDFKYKVGINTGYSDNKVLDMDFKTDYYYRQIKLNGRSDIGLWGMQCIGMFRSFQDIDEYFEKYHITSYMGKTKDQVRPGMLIYKDVRGAQHIDANGVVTYDGPDGIVDEENDQVELGHRSNMYGATMNLSAEWKGISLTAQVGANWGGYTTLPASAIKPFIAGQTADDVEWINMPSFWNVDNMYSYENIYDAQGNLVVAQNRDGLYPNLAYSSVNSVTSSFWRISSARVALNRLTLAYSVPKAFLAGLGIGLQSARFNVTAQNLLDFYNPYPDSFTTPLAGSYGSYPNLRKWTIGVNLTF